MPFPPVSFELFPPRSDAAAIALGRTIDLLAAVDPEFISVTFGAGGSLRGRSLTVLRYILEHTTIEPMAHLTCVGNTHDEANILVREFLDQGITSFLALRGDPPQDGSGEVGSIGSAAELVQLIHRVQEERMPFSQEPVPGTRRARRIRQRPRPERVAVAAFPTGHPRSHDIQQDIDTLLAKQVAGATLAITQMFFHSSDYISFVERAVDAGVTIPILPGIMPITSPQKLKRVCELTGETPPAELQIDLEIEPEKQRQFEVGVSFATRLADEVLAAGAPGIHLYTFNRHEAALAVLRSISTPRTAREDTP